MTEHQLTAQFAGSRDEHYPVPQMSETADGIFSWHMGPVYARQMAKPRLCSTKYQDRKRAQLRAAYLKGTSGYQAAPGTYRQVPCLGTTKCQSKVRPGVTSELFYEKT